MTWRTFAALEKKERAEESEAKQSKTSAKLLKPKTLSLGRSAFSICQLMLGRCSRLFYDSYIQIQIQIHMHKRYSYSYSADTATDRRYICSYNALWATIVVNLNSKQTTTSGECVSVCMCVCLFMYMFIWPWSTSRIRSAVRTAHTVRMSDVLSRFMPCLISF